MYAKSEPIEERADEPGRLVMRVDIHDLGFVYRSPGGPVGTHALSDLALIVESGSVHALVGPSGCGKTTLLRLLAGLEVPDRGFIDFVGHQRREHLTSFVFQTPRLIPWWTVERNVAIGSEFRHSEAMYRKVAEFHTKQVGLAEMAHRYPATLSRGQQTRVGLGRGLAHDAEVLLLDEPFVNLDAISRRRLYEEFETYWQLDPHTTVLVTHDIEEAVKLADRVSVMRASPGPLLETVEIEAERPRAELPPGHAGIRSAIGRIWTLLEAAR
ncbi:MAG: ABC transporter ATP-binding protein [Acidimicrobiia bacterium]